MLRPRSGFKTDRWFNVPDGNDRMNASRKSDGSVVPAKSANKNASEAFAERMEERDPAKSEPAPENQASG
jgi:hypothetical protein